MSEQIRNWIQRNREQILEVNRKLVSIPSENLYPYGNELQVQLEINHMLQSLGFQTDVFRPTDVQGLTEHEAFLNDGRIYDNRPNVVGLRRGDGGGRSLLFSGHADTVPRGIEGWTHDPFAGEIVGDKQYGLGIYDMKGGTVAAMMAAKCVLELGYSLAGDLIIESVVDEEFGGANGTLASRLRGYQTDAAIITEPTNLAICPINQGGLYLRISFHGRGLGRSTTSPKSTNPIFAAARFLEIIRQYDEWRNKNALVPALYTWHPNLVTMVQVLRAGNTELALSDRAPNTCSFDVWMQYYPGVTEEEAQQEFENFYKPLVENDEILKEIEPKVEKKIRYLPGSGIREDHPILEVLKQSGEGAAGSGLEYRGMAFACDSFMFNHHSATPAVILGPSGDNAHAPDEYININDFMTLIEVYANTIIEWCGGSLR